MSYEWVLFRTFLARVREFHWTHGVATSNCMQHHIIRGCYRVLRPSQVLRMATILEPDAEGIARAAAMIKAGDCVAFPTGKRVPSSHWTCLNNSQKQCMDWGQTRLLKKLSWKFLSLRGVRWQVFTTDCLLWFCCESGQAMPHSEWDLMICNVWCRPADRTRWECGARAWAAGLRWGGQHETPANIIIWLTMNDLIANSPVFDLDFRFLAWTDDFRGQGAWLDPIER